MVAFARIVPCCRGITKVICCLIRPGARGVCIREVQRDLKESAKLLLEDKISRHGLGRYFDVFDREIRCHGGGLIIFRGMNDYTADSIKSLEGFDWAWVEEAHTLTAKSLELLRPTLERIGDKSLALILGERREPINDVLGGGVAHRFDLFCPR